MLPDFSDVTVAAIERTTAHAVATADDAVRAMVGAAEPRTYANTMALLEEAATAISDATGLGPFMARVHPDEAVRKAGTVAEEQLTKWSTDLVFRRDVAAAIRRYAGTEDAARLTGTRRRLLEHWQRDLRRAGHDLAPEEQGRLQKLRNRLIELEVAFAANLDAFEDHIDMTRADLDGLSDDYVERLAAGAGESTYRVTLAYPEYFPFIRRARSRSMRRALQHKFLNMCAEANMPLLVEALDLRRRIAHVLGYANWAEYSVEVKMADGVEDVERFYSSIVGDLTRLAAAEKAAMQERLDVDEPGAELQPWDMWFYDNEQRREEHGIDQDVVASHFPLDQVVAGMFATTGAVFGLEYREIDTATWHPDVTTYEMRDRESGEPIAYFYADLFPRPGKYGHAAAFSIVYGKGEPGGYRKPVAAIVANFTKPTQASPSLLQHDEVVTLFHEFGHILHFCLTTVDLIRFSGYDTEWDFVEAPSQIMEHWTWEPAVLQRFARHHRTGESIPQDLVARLVAARNLNIGLFTLRQVFLGRLDLAMHRATTAVDLDDLSRRTHDVTQLPYHEGTHFVAGFGHLMGGYDAGYYGYLWSEVYGDDMYSVFEREGIDDPATGRRYREEILATGGSRDASEHLRAFLGREPSSEAFLRKLGIDEPVVGTPPPGSLQ